MQWLERFTRRSTYIGVALLLLCALLNVGDIATRRLSSLNLTGMVDITQLMVMTCAFMCIPYTFMREAHIDVDFITSHLPPRLNSALMGVWSLAGALFMAAVTWYAGVAALQAYVNHDQSTTIGIPIVWYWVPLLFGCVLSVLACSSLVFAHWLRAARGADKGA